MNLIRIQDQVINADKILAVHIDEDIVSILLADRTLELDGSHAEILKNWLEANAFELTEDMQPQEMRSRPHLMHLRTLNRSLFKEPAVEAG